MDTVFTKCYNYSNLIDSVMLSFHRYCSYIVLGYVPCVWLKCSYLKCWTVNEKTESKHTCIWFLYVSRFDNVADVGACTVAILFVV